MRLAIAFSCLLLLGFEQSTASDQIPGAPQTRPIAITNAVIHTVSGDTIQLGTIVFDNGKIVQVAKGRPATLPEKCKVVDAGGKHVYPGLIEAQSNVGLVEVNSVRASVDERETGQFNPNVRSSVAFNPDSEHIPVARANGVLLAVSAPGGGIVSGRSNLMMMDGWTWESMTLQPDVAMQVRWPSSESQVNEFQTLLEQTRRYIAARRGKTSQPKDLRLEAMIPVVQGKMPIIAYATSIDRIEDVVAFCQREKLKLIIYGGYAAAECADLLIKTNTPVIVNGVYRNPSSRHTAYDAPYSLPGKLAELGVKFCISNGGRFGSSGLRNLPYSAATAAAYGLGEEEALKAITLSAAEILGVSDRVGALSVGMDATLFVADGNILETPTQVVEAFIQGRRVDLSSKHTQLYEKYTEKYKQLEVE